MKKEGDVDTSGLKVRINDRVHEVTGFRIITVPGDGEDKSETKWMQFGMQDIETKMSQCVEFEVSGVISFWNQLTGLPDQVRSIFEGISGFGKDVAKRFERAAKAFGDDIEKKE